MTLLSINSETNEGIKDIIENNTSIHYEIGNSIYRKSLLINVEKQYQITDSSNALIDKESLDVKYKLTFLENNQNKTYTTSYSPKEVGKSYFYITNHEDEIETIFLEQNDIETSVRKNIIDKIKYIHEDSGKILPVLYFMGFMHSIFSVSSYLTGSMSDIFSILNSIYVILLFITAFSISSYIENKKSKTIKSAFKALNL